MITKSFSCLDMMTKSFFLPGYDDNVFDDQILELHSVDLLLVQHLTIHILMIVLELKKKQAISKHLIVL